MKARPSGSWRMHLQRSTQLRTSLQYHLLPLCSFPLPICARPLISQRIKKKLAWLKERELGICGLPLPQLGLVSVTEDHDGLACFSHPFSRLYPGVNQRGCAFCCTILWRSNCYLCFGSCQQNAFFFHFILASVACTLQKAFSESRFHKLQSPRPISLPVLLGCSSLETVTSFPILIRSSPRHVSFSRKRHLMDKH